MMHQRTLAAVFTVLAALAIGSVVHARPPETDDDLRRQLKDLKDQVDTLKQSVELDRQAIRNRLSDLDDKLGRIELLLRGSAIGSAASPAVPYRQSRIVEPIQGRYGNIRLDNRLGVTAEVTIDGTTFSVPPLSTRLLRNQPAGQFVYDVTADGFGITSPRRTTLTENTTWTLTIY